MAPGMCEALPRRMPRDHFVGGELALATGPQRHEHAAGVDGVAAAQSATTHRADDSGHIGVFAHRLDELGKARLHGLKRGLLVGLDLARQASRVLLRKEPLVHVNVEIHGQPDGAEGDEHHHGLVPEDPRQRALIAAQNPVENGFVEAVDAPVPFLAVALQKARAHHRRGGQRHQERNQNGGGKRHRKFAEQPPHNPGHQQNGDEHGDQREAHGHYRGADLLGAQQRRPPLASYPLPGAA